MLYNMSKLLTLRDYKSSKMSELLGLEAHQHKSYMHLLTTHGH
jgi:hypothetical protein